LTNGEGIIENYAGKKKRKPKEEKKVKNRPEKTGYKKKLAVRAKQPGRGGEITGR